MTRASDTAKLLGAGATILDGTTISTADNTAQLELVSTDADSGIGPHQVFYRNSSSPADADLLCELDFRGRNDNSQDVNYATVNVKASDVSDGTEDGEYILQVMTAGSVDTTMHIKPAEIVFNEDSIDRDFRVESNGNANMLFVDGGNDKIGIGLNSPGTSLHIRSSVASNIAGYRDGTTGLIVEGDAASYIQLVASKTNPMAILFDGGDTHNDTARGGIIYDIDTGLSFKSGGSTRWTINETGNLLPSATSLGVYLGVTSATASNLLDDYEEGSFTATFSASGATIGQSVSKGTYTKIGNQVNINIYVQCDGTVSLNSNALSITGLPFTAANTSQVIYYGPPAGMRFISMSSNYYNLMPYINSGDNTVQMYQHGKGQAPIALPSSGLSNSSGQIFIQMFYYV